MALPEARSLASQGFDAQLGRSLREGFGPATIGNSRAIAGAVFPSVLTAEHLAVIPRLLQSFESPLIPIGGHAVYKEYIANFEIWNEVLRIMQVSPQERTELFDPVLPAIFDMLIVPKLITEDGKLSDSGLPTRIFELRTIDFPREAYLTGFLPIRDRFGMTLQHGALSITKVATTHTAVIHS